MRCLSRLLMFLVLCVVAVGGELITNGDFETPGAGGSDIFATWIETTTTGNAGVQDVDNNQVHGGTSGTTHACNLWTDDTSSVEIYQEVLTAGVSYRAIVQCTAYNNGPLVIAFHSGAAEVGQITGVGTYVFYGVADGDRFVMKRQFGSSCDVTIDNISVVEIDVGLNCYIGGSLASPNFAGYSHLSASVSVDTDGSNIYTAPALADTEGSGGKMLITTATDLPDVTGVFCNISVNAGSEGTGRFEIIAVDTSPDGADTILIDLDWVDDVTDIVTIFIGGALPASYNVEAYDLENVMDDDDGFAAAAIAASGDFNIYATGTLAVGEQLLFDNLEGAGNNWVRLIGCDASYIPSVTGTQGFILDADATDLGTSVMRLITQERIQILNVAFLNNDSGGGGTPIDGEDGLELVASTGTQYGVLIENCSFDNCFRGIYVHGDYEGVIIKDCTAGLTTPNQSSCIENDAVGTEIVGGNWIAKAGQLVFDLDATCNIRGAVIREGIYGVDIAATGNYSINGCSFYNQTDRGVRINSANAIADFTNNIFYVADSANDYAIRYNAGAYTEYNNITNADTLALSGFVNSTGYNLDFTNSNPFIDASAGNFRLRSRSPARTGGLPDFTGTGSFIGALIPLTAKTNEAYGGDTNVMYGGGNSIYDR